MQSCEYVMGLYGVSMLVLCNVKEELPGKAPPPPRCIVVVGVETAVLQPAPGNEFIVVVAVAP